MYTDAVYGEMLREQTLKGLTGKGRRLVEARPEERTPGLRIPADATAQQARAMNKAIGDVNSRYKGNTLIDTVNWVPADERRAFIARHRGKTIDIDPELWTDDFVESVAVRAERVRKSQARVDRMRARLAEEADFIGDDEMMLIKNRIERMEKTIARESTSARFSVPETLDEIVTHELGHAVELDLQMGAFPDIIDFLPPSELRALGHDPANFLGMRLETIAKQRGHLLSEYATTDGGEYFAEAFTAYMKGEREGIVGELLNVFDGVMR